MIAKLTERQKKAYCYVLDKFHAENQQKNRQEKNVRETPTLKRAILKT